MPAIEHINLSVSRNEILGIAGESGSGKSVTSLAMLKLLSRNAVYSSGEILFSADGHKQVDVLRLSEQELQALRGSGIAMIFQEPMTSLNPVLTCGDQVMEAIRIHQGVSTADAKLRTLELFEKVKLPDPSLMIDRYPHQLSGGQKQRVMIAMAMSGNPSLLICDEPTTALDVTVQKTILELIKELQVATGMGVIFITHDLGVISEIADRVAVMYHGKVVEEGIKNEMLHHPKNEYTKGLLSVNRYLREEKGAPAPAQSREVLIDVRNLSVWFAARKTLLGKPLSYTKAVDNVNFQVFKGETLGLVGESGCGKTTLGRTLLRLVEPVSGSISYAGLDLLRMKGEALRAFRRNMQIVFQDPYSSLNPSLTIGAAIEEPMKVHDIETSRSARKERVAELLQKVKLDPSHMNRYPHEFSGGQRQRIVIARALALKPAFLVCDESVSALDVSVQAQVLQLLNELKMEFGYTCIFISHDLSVVRYISDRIMVMKRGAIEESGNTSEVFHTPASPYTRKLLESMPKSLPLHA